VVPIDWCLADPWGDQWVNCLMEWGRVAKPDAERVA
jgi:hypothetical protein